MPTEESVNAEEEALVEELFQKEYHNLVRYAETILRKHGSNYVSVSGRAEDVVQEVFYLALKKNAQMMKREVPAGWFYTTLTHKVREALREDRAWVKRLTLIQSSVPESEMSRKLPVEWTGLMSQEEYELLYKLYLEGYTYNELSAELGVKKSTLAMRVRRIKKRFRENYKNFD